MRRPRLGATLCIQRRNLWTNVDDHLVPDVLARLGLEAIKTLARLGKGFVPVPGLPGRTGLPGPDDDSRVHSIAWHQQLSADPARLALGRREPLPHGGVPFGF